MPTEYSGPPMKELLTNHALADAVIQYHDGPSQNQILDDTELTKLGRFVSDTNERESILEEEGLDPKDIDGYKGSLASYIILKHGHGDIFNQDEIEKLKHWFKSGVVFRS